jgi:integrase/recombinase XerD
MHGNVLRSLPSKWCVSFRSTPMERLPRRVSVWSWASVPVAAHESPRTTRLYDRTGDDITLDEVERISI